MKRNFFFTLSLLLLFALSSFGQDTVTKKERTTQWYIGAGGNFNSTWIINQNNYGEPNLDYKFTPSWAGNINLGFDFSDYWGFKFEVGYAQLGQKYDGMQYNQPANRDIKLTYVLIPIMIKFHAGGETAKFYAMAGPQLGLLLSAKQTYERNGSPAPPYNSIDVSKEDIKDRYTSAAGFVRLDFGIELTPGKHLLIDIGLSNAFSITDLNASGWRYKNEDGDYKISHNYYAGLNIGINYRW